MRTRNHNSRRAGHIQTLLVSVGGLLGCVAFVAIGERVHLKFWLKSLGLPTGSPPGMMLGLVLLAASMVAGTLLITLLYSLLIKFFEWREGR